MHYLVTTSPTWIYKTPNMKMSFKGTLLLVVSCLVAISILPTAEGFNVAVKDTKCNLDPNVGEINNPCGSLYDAECGGKYCKCPIGTHEDANLKRCVPGAAPKKSSGGTQAAGGEYDPFDDILDTYPGKPSAPGGPVPAGPGPTPPPARPQPQPPRQPQPQPPHQNQPGYNPSQPGYNPNQPGYNPNQPGYNPGYNPNQPGYNPNQPGYNPNQPGYNPNRPGYNPNQPGHNNKGGGGANNVGEKAGGGVGGVIGLLLIGGIIYFCCCRGGKHKEVLNKFGGGRFQGIPFMRGGQQQAAPGVQMQHSMPVQQDPNFASQHTYVPPPGQDPGQYPPPQQPYPPPAGYIPDNQQPPPYSPQYQPNAPPPQ